MDLVQIGPSPQRMERDRGPQGVLTDRYQRQVRYLRLSLSDRCNLKCTYCRPEAGIEHVERSELLSHEELIALVREFARWGVDRVRLTGGEPTVRRGIVDLVAQLRAIQTGRKHGEGQIEVVMTSNGELLPSLAKDLFSAGLSGLTISIDSLQEKRYRDITRNGSLKRVLEGIDAIQHAGFRNVKLNTVAIAGFNDDEFAQLCAFAWERDFYPRFIELMPMSSGQLYVPGELMPAAEIRDTIAAAHGATHAPDDARGIAGMGPASYHKLQSGRYAGRRFGTIAAMTENFCASCNRLRVSSTGQLQACLARDASRDLRAALRGSKSSRSRRLQSAVRSALGQKTESHDFARDGSGGPQKSMLSIGG